VASLSQGRTAAAQRGLFTHKSVPVIFEPPCTLWWNLDARNAKAPSRPSTSSLTIPHYIHFIYSAPILRSLSTKQHHALCSAVIDTHACEHSTAAHSAGGSTIYSSLRHFSLNCHS